MTQDDIIRMAKEADVWVAGQEPYQTQLERFASLVAAAEREACAKICIEIANAALEQDKGTMSDGRVVYMGDHNLYGEYEGATKSAAAIRARGNNETQTLQDAVRNP